MNEFQRVIQEQSDLAVIEELEQKIAPDGRTAQRKKAKQAAMVA